MPINTSSQFDLRAQLPLRLYSQVADLTARDAIPTINRYDGFESYVVATQIAYRLQGGITNSDWVVGVNTEIEKYLSAVTVNSIADVDFTITQGSDILGVDFSHTHPASEISDFDTEVANNTDVTLNTTHRGLTDDPHNVTATQVGLGNVTDVATDDTAYNTTSWDANADAATKNAIRDKIETMDTAIGLNTSKVTNATHTGDVTGATALTIGVDKVLDSHINWGTGATQVSTADIPEQTNLYYTEARVAANSSVALNTAKVTNVSTNLSEGASTETTVDVNSSDGTNATLVSASISRAGLLTKTKWDEIVANTAKTSSQWDAATGGINYAGGNVGIDTTTPAYTLDVSGNIGLTGSIYQSGTSAQLDINPYALMRVGRNTNNAAFALAVYLGTATNTTNHYLKGVGNSYVCSNNGNFAIGDITATYKLDVNGTGRFTGAFLLDSTFGFSTAGVTNIDRVLDEDDLTSDSAVALATQQSIKAYVDASVTSYTFTTGLTNTAGTVKLGDADIDESVELHFDGANTFKMYSYDVLSAATDRSTLDFGSTAISLEAYDLTNSRISRLSLAHTFSQMSFYDGNTTPSSNAVIRADFEKAELSYNYDTSKTSKVTVKENWITLDSDTVDLKGGYIGYIATKINNYTIVESDYTILADATSNIVAITLPASPNQGQMFNIKCIDATFTCTISPNGNNIDGQAGGIALSLNDSYILQYDTTYGWAEI